MPYKLIIIVLSISFLPGQSLLNRWMGTDPFMGSARSTAMGSTHLLNSTGSANVRFNPASLAALNSNWGINLQLDRSSIFERWSMPMRDSFGEFLKNADYVANEFSYFGINSGVFATANFPVFGTAGAGFHYAPLTHFTYYYLEEVRGSYQIEDGEYSSKDPVIGYQNLNTEGTLMVSSLGGGIILGSLGDIDMSLGAAINLIQSTKILDRVEVDSLYSDVTNLTTYPDVDNSTKLPSAKFISMSINWNLTSTIKIGAGWEAGAKSTTTQYSWSIDSTNGLFQYWEDSSFAISGINYMKPEIISLGLSLISDLEQMMSVDFEVNQVSYSGHLNLQNYRIFKFGFEYITQMGTPVRGGLVYKTPAISAMKPVSMFTFGTGKTMNSLLIDAAATYSLHSFNYPDLFPVEGDIRSDYDLVRDSQLYLQLALTYRF